MPYENVGVRSLYNACSSHYGDQDIHLAMAWVNAENVEAVWKVVQTWFELMEAGRAVDRYPDPFWETKHPMKKRPVTREMADRLIAELDADFQLEDRRFPDGKGPEFNRLPAHARVAFAQEVYGVMKSEGEIEAEARRRIRSGERLPPEDWYS